MIQNTTIVAMGRIKSSILIGRDVVTVIAAALLLISLFGGVVEAGISVVDLNETDLTETVDIDTEPLLNTGGSTNLNHDANNVVPTDVCEVYLKIDDSTCVGYEVYVDGVYQFTEGQGTTPDGYCAFYVTEGTHPSKYARIGVLHLSRNILGPVFTRAQYSFPDGS